MRTFLIAVLCALLQACAHGNGQYDSPNCLPIESRLPAPLRWGALSGLSADPQKPDILYSVHDHNLAGQHIYTLKLEQNKAILVSAIEVQPLRQSRYDLEGIAKRAAGGFWLVSEGKPGRRQPNLLLRVNDTGQVMEEIPLTASLQGERRKAGFEGVAVLGEGVNERVLVAIQRSWPNDLPKSLKLLEYQIANQRWRVHYYPLEKKKKIGVSALSAFNGQFAVLERDNKSLRRSSLKRIYQVSLNQQGGTVKKQLLMDLLQAINPWLCSNQGKLEGMAFDRRDQLYLVDDDDGAGTARLLRFQLK